MKYICAFVLLCTACAVPAQRLHELSIAPRAGQLPSTDKSLLLYPFEDERPADAARLPFIDFVPVVDWFYLALTQEYPENGGFLGASGLSLDSEAIVGSLPHALPHLLGRGLRQSGAATNWVAVDSVDPQRDLSKFDYVVRGKLKQARLHVAGSLIPLAVLSIVGVPFAFTDYDVELEVILLRNVPQGGELWRKTYTWHGKKAIGLYYHWRAFRELFVASLEALLPAMVQDLAAALPR